MGGVCAASGGIWRESLVGLRIVPVPRTAHVRLAWRERRGENHRCGLIGGGMAWLGDGTPLLMLTH